MQKTIMKFEYHTFLIPEDISIDESMKLMRSLVPITGDYVDGKTLYSPTGEQVNISIDFIDEDDFRKPTKEEKENQEISQLKYSVKSKDAEVEKLKEKVKSLECEVKLQQKETPNES